MLKNWNALSQLMDDWAIDWKDNLDIICNSSAENWKI